MTAGAILINLIFVLKKDIGILQKVAIVGVISVIVNVAIITFTFFVGFSVNVEDKDSGITIEYIYHGITSIPWG